jgi:hypothetical protein
MASSTAALITTPGVEAFGGRPLPRVGVAERALVGVAVRLVRASSALTGEEYGCAEDEP